MNQMHKRRDWCNERRDFWYERFLKEVFWGNSGCGKPEFMKAGFTQRFKKSAILFF
jgi:hypothetical protein